MGICKSPLTRRFCLILILVVAARASAANWPAWRGPNGTGVSSDTDPPVKWDEKENILIWQERLSGNDGNTGSWSSIVLAGGRLYVPNQSGDVFVLKASQQFELIRTNSVHEPTNASLAASDGAIFLRTDKNLWCIGGTQSPNNRESGRDRGAVPE